MHVITLIAMVGEGLYQTTENSASEARERHQLACGQLKALSDEIIKAQLDALEVPAGDASSAGAPGLPLYDPLEGKALHNGIRYKPTTKEQCISLLSRAWKTVGILMDSTWFKVVLPQRVCSRNTVRYHVSRNSTYNGPYMSEDPVKAFRFFLRVLLRSPPPKNQATAGTSNASARPTLPVPVQATTSTAASSSVVRPTPRANGR